jgi:hypothetical protein
MRTVFSITKITMNIIISIMEQLSPPEPKGLLAPLWPSAQNSLYSIIIGIMNTNKMTDVLRFKPNI